MTHEADHTVSIQASDNRNDERASVFVCGMSNETSYSEHCCYEAIKIERVSVLVCGMPNTTSYSGLLRYMMTHTSL